MVCRHHQRSRMHKMHSRQLSDGDGGIHVRKRSIAAFLLVPDLRQLQSRDISDSSRQQHMQHVPRWHVPDRNRYVLMTDPIARRVVYENPSKSIDAALHRYHCKSTPSLIH